MPPGMHWEVLPLLVVEVRITPLQLVQHREAAEVYMQQTSDAPTHAWHTYRTPTHAPCQAQERACARPPLQLAAAECSQGRPD